MNNVTLIGRLTKDVSTEKTTTGLSTCKYTLAVDRPNAKDKADFINCVAWRQSADYLGQYAKKGDLVSTEGTIQTRTYDDKEGRKVYVTEVVANRVSILNSAKREEVKEDPAPLDYGYGNLEISRDDLPF